MASSMGDDRFAPPQAHVADVELPTDGLVLASRRRRLAAVLLDSMVMFFLFLLVSAVTSWYPFNSSNRAFWSPQWGNIFWNTLAFLLPNAYLLATRGQSIGKALLQIRIVRPDGATATLARVLGLRYGVGYVVNIIPGLGIAYIILDSLLIFRSSKRCLHDQIADTVVIKL